MRRGRQHAITGVCIVCSAYQCPRPPCFSFFPLPNFPSHAPSPTLLSTHRSHGLQYPLLDPADRLVLRVIIYAGVARLTSACSAVNTPAPA